MLEQQIPEPSFWAFFIQLPFYLPSNRRRNRDLRSAWAVSANTHTHTLSSHIPGYGKAWLWQVVWSVSVLIASVFWESCWVELDSSFLNLSAPVLGLSVDLSIPRKKLVCVRRQSRGVLNHFKAVSRVIPFFFFFFWWKHLGGCTLSINAPVSFLLSTVAAPVSLCGMWFSVSHTQSPDTEKSSGFFSREHRENQSLNIIYWLPGIGVFYWS